MDLGDVPQNDLERGFVGGGVWGCVKRILGQREQGGPVRLVGVNEDAEILFQALVSAF